MKNENNDQGTPKSIDETIHNAICIGPIRETPQRLRAHIRDFMAQKATIAEMKGMTPIEFFKMIFEE